MAETAFEQIASAEAEAKRIKDAGAEKQRADIAKAVTDGEKLVAAAKKKADDSLTALGAQFEKETAANRENDEREIKIKCSFVRTKAGERRKAALDHIFRGVTNVGN